MGKLRLCHLFFLMRLSSSLTLNKNDSPLINQSHDSEKSIPKRGPRYCCCFKTKRACCGSICALLVLLLIGLAVLTFFLFPRAPTIIINDPVLDQNPIVFGAGKSGSTLINLKVDGFIYSPNYISVWLNKVDFEGKVENLDGTVNPDIRINGSASNINVQSFANTTITMVKKQYSNKINFSSATYCQHYLISSSNGQSH